MATRREPVCFTCGGSVTIDAFHNRLEDGKPCPACRARLLDEAPSLLPREAPEPEDAFDDEDAFEAYDFEARGPRPFGPSPDDSDGPIGA